MVHSIFFLSFLISTAFAGNDWTKPCLAGVCFYDLPASASSASGTLKIWGPEDAISDITPAAGWEILGCSPDLLSQDIRLVCKDDQLNAEECAHLYKNAGAEGKIVRLPENCGSNAFARIARAWVSEDQTIPESIARRIVRRDGVQPEVKALHLDTDFSSIDATKIGTVEFAIRAANVPGAEGDIITSPATQRRSRVIQRGLFDFVGDAIDAVSNLNTFDIDKTKTLDPFDIAKNFNLVDQNLSCPPVDAGLKIDVDAKAHAIATIGVAASGTIVPPKIEDFAVITSLTADLDGTINLNGGVTGTLDSGKINLFQIGIPGLDFPGILTIGPSFRIDAQAKAILDLNVDLSVGINYHIDKAQLVFPPNSEKAAGGTFQVGDTPLKLSVSPSVKATGTVEAHLIPSLNLGISALGGIADATVFLELDASATMTLNLQAEANADATLDKAKRSADRFALPIVKPRGHTTPGYYYWNPLPLTTPSTATTTEAAYSTQTVTGSATPSGREAEEHQPDTNTSSSIPSASSATVVGSSSDGPTPSPSPPSPPSPSPSVSVDAGSSEPKTGWVLTTNTGSSFGGCFDITTGLDVNAGANADFFGLFNKETKVSLFSKKFELFKKCFGSQSNARRRSHTPTSRFERSMRARAYYSVIMRQDAGLACPAADTSAPEPVVDEVVPSAEVKEVS